MFGCPACLSPLHSSKAFSSPRPHLSSAYSHVLVLSCRCVLSSIVPPPPSYISRLSIHSSAFVVLTCWHCFVSVDFTFFFCHVCLSHLSLFWPSISLPLSHLFLSGNGVVILVYELFWLLNIFFHHFRACIRFSVNFSKDFYVAWKGDDFLKFLLVLLLSSTVFSFNSFSFSPSVALSP